MSFKAVVLREKASRDVDDARSFYLSEGAPEAAAGFIDALSAACAHIARHAATGSTRFAHELDLPGLRSWPLSLCPYLIFYVERDDHIDVWRVLHQRRDVPAWMQAEERGE